GAKGNEGVANNVANTKGSIGYVEYAYALQNKLTFTKMINKDGKTVAPTSAAFQAAAANAKWDSQPGYGVILANQPGAESWPMTAATWILMHAKPQDPAAATEALKFFAWAYDKGGKMAEQLDRRDPVVDLAQGQSGVTGEAQSRAKILDRLRIGDAVFRNITRLAALAVLVILGGVMISLVIGASPALREFGLNFLIEEHWN